MRAPLVLAMTAERPLWALLAVLVCCLSTRPTDALRALPSCEAPQEAGGAVRRPPPGRRPLRNVFKKHASMGTWSPGGSKGHKVTKGVNGQRQKHFGFDDAEVMETPPPAFSWADMAASTPADRPPGKEPGRRLGNCVVCRAASPPNLQLHFVRKSSKAPEKDYMFMFLPFTGTWAPHAVVQDGQPCPAGMQMMAESFRDTPSICLARSLWYLKRHSPNPGVWDEQVKEGADIAVGSNLTR